MDIGTIENRALAMTTPAARNKAEKLLSIVAGSVKRRIAEPQPQLRGWCMLFLASPCQLRTSREAEPTHLEFCQPGTVLRVVGCRWNPGEDRAGRAGMWAVCVVTRTLSSGRCWYQRDRDVETLTYKEVSCTLLKNHPQSKHSSHYYKSFTTYLT